MEKVVIAGGAGYLGSHLADRICDRYDVYIVDSLVTGRLENINHLLRLNQVRFIQDSIENINYLNLGKVDKVFHLASIASPKVYQELPLETAMANSAGTLAVLNFAKNNGAKVLYTSTSEVYGDPQVNPQPETYYGSVNCHGIRACYDESKRFGETLCFIFKDYVDVKIVRLFNSYGPRMNPEDGRVFTTFISQALRGESLTIYQGEQTRSFCYSSDTIDGILKVMEFGDSNPYNIGNPDERKIIEVAELVIKLTGSKSRLRICPLPKDDPKKRCPDISRVKELGWNPKIDLEEGLSLMIKKVKEELCLTGKL